MTAPASTSESGPRHRPQRQLRWWHWTLIGLALAGAVGGLAGLDKALYDWTITYVNTDVQLDDDFYHRTRRFWDVMRWIAGSAYGVLGFYFLLFAVRPRGERVANAMLIAVLLAGSATFVLKNAFGRERPNRDPTHLSFKPNFSDWWTDQGLSFPSGEATIAFALATAVTCAWPGTGWLMFPLALLCTLGRLVQGSHHLSDVLIGALLGWSIARTIYPRALDWMNALFGGGSGPQQPAMQPVEHQQKTALDDDGATRRPDRRSTP